MAAATAALSAPISASSPCLQKNASSPSGFFSPRSQTIRFPTTLTRPLKALTLARYSASAGSSDFSPAATNSPIAKTDAGASRTSLKTRLSNGETLYGLFLLSFSPTLAEIAALAGYDYVVIDMEHGPGGIPEALDCLRALSGTGTPAILRIPETSAAWAKKALDLGPDGIMFPMIDSPKEARKAVSYCRFPPDGIRGTAHPVVRASSYGIDEDYLGNYVRELFVMCQVESEEGAKNAGRIAAVEGVDGVQMGPLDLSASLGYLWDPGNKKVMEVMMEAEREVLAAGGAYLGGFAMAHDPPDRQRQRGYQMVSGAVDVGLFRAVVVEDVRRFKMGMGEVSDDANVTAKEDDEDEKYWSE